MVKQLIKYNLNIERVTQCVSWSYIAQTPMQLSQCAWNLEVETWDLEGFWEWTAVDSVEIA